MSKKERMQILRMIEEGKISASEGADLLRAIQQEGDIEPEEPLKGGSSPKWLRVRVTDLDSGRQKANINVPLGLVNVGMRMGARFAPEISGVKFDELISAVEGGAEGRIIDVEDIDDNERVEIFVE